MAEQEIPTKRLSHSEIIRLLAERATRQPSFGVSQVKAVGGATVFEWEVNVPVCEEYPTALSAFSAMLSFGQKMREAYPATAAPAAPAAVSGTTGRGRRVA